MRRAVVFTLNRGQENVVGVNQDGGMSSLESCGIRVVLIR
jgi:hypothetical protein